MKTTIEIADGLFAEAKQYAHAHDLSFREVVESGLRKVVSESGTTTPFLLKDGSFAGDGMVKDFSWPELRALIYEGHGG